MINKTIENLLGRRSVRTYSSEPISDRDRQLMFDCAMRAPTAGNMMLYSMIEVSDQGLKDRLAVSCDNQPFIAKAPLVVLFLADYQRMFDFYKASGVEAWAAEEGRELRSPQEGDLFLAINDALIAAQTMVIAAESLGIGACYIGDIMENYELHSEIFDLPEYTFPITLICFGYPKNDGPKKQIPRFDPGFVKFENKYSRFEDRELIHLMDGLEQWQRGGKPHDYDEGNIGCYQYRRKFDADFTKEMNRSVRAALEKWKK